MRFGIEVLDWDLRRTQGKALAKAGAEAQGRTWTTADDTDFDAAANALDTYLATFNIPVGSTINVLKQVDERADGAFYLILQVTATPPDVGS